MPILLFVEGRDLLEMKRRLNDYWSFHNSLLSVMRELKPHLVFSVHSFTPCYEGQQRTLEVGVVCNADETLAEAYNKHLIKESFVSRYVKKHLVGSERKKI